MESATLRQLWSTVEETQTSILLKLSDTELVKHLVAVLDSRQSIDSKEMSYVSAYLSTKTALIRDLAQSRMV